MRERKETSTWNLELETEAVDFCRRRLEKPRSLAGTEGRIGETSEVGEPGRGPGQEGGAEAGLGGVMLQVTLRHRGHMLMSQTEQQEL